MLVHARRVECFRGFVEHIYVNDAGVVDVEIDLPYSEENGVSYRSTSFASLLEAVENIGIFLECSDSWVVPVSHPEPESVGAPDYPALRAALRTRSYPLPNSAFSFTGMEFWVRGTD